MQPLIEVPPSNIVPPPIFRTQKVHPKKEPLILNMIVEIDTKSVNIGKKSKFFIRFRPYGSK